MSFETGGIGTDGPWVQFAGNDSTDEFALDHKIYDQAHVIVLLTVDATLVTTIQTITTEYTVADVATDAHDGTTPTITMVTPPATGETLTLYRIGTLIQSTTFQSTQFWQTLSAELRLDLIVMDLQYLKLLLDRTAQGSLASAAVTTTIEEILATTPLSDLSALTAKAVLVAADILLIGDSADSFANKRATLTNLVTFLSATFLSSPLTAALNADGNDITNLKTATFNLVDTTTPGATQTIDWSAGIKQRITLDTAACTLTFTDPLEWVNLTFVIVQDGSGSRTIVWPGNVKWSGGTEPTLTTDADAIDIITFVYNATDDEYYSVTVTNLLTPP